MAAGTWGLGRGRSMSIILMLLALSVTRSVALTQQYCSSQNTGSDSSAVSNNYQSNGACSTTCAGFAFAVVQGKNCWCSNYIPASTTSTGSCSVACPGYPYENCGDSSSGLFGYVALGKAPLGTQGAASSSTPTQATSTTQATQPTIQAVSTQSPPGTPSRSPTPLGLASPFSSSTIPVLRPSLPFPGSPTLIPSTPISFKTQILTLPAQNFSPDPAPVTVQDTVTDQPSVQVSYVSITPSTTSTSTTPTPTLIPVSITLDPQTTPTTSSTSTTPTTPTTPTTTKASTSSTSSSTTWSPTPFMSVMTVTGEIMTLTVTPTAPPSVATTIAAAAQNNNGGFWSSQAKVGGVFTVVTLAVIAIIAGIIFFLLRRRRHSDIVTVPSTTGNNTPQRRPSRLSQMGLIGGVHRQATVPSIQTSGWGPGTSTEKSPADTLNADRRSSYPRVVDQRLEPTALWNPLHSNGSHVSMSSFRDDQDYSRRMLRIANPDSE